MKEVQLPPPIEGLEGLYSEVIENPVAYATFFWKFTKEQHRAIKKRDQNRCNFPSEEHGGSLQVHHIVPKSLESRTGIEVDHPLNGITVCTRCHQRIHTPNGHDCAYTTDRGAVIWNEEWDDELSARALSNTRKAIKKGWRFPK